MLLLRLAVFFMGALFAGSAIAAVNNDTGGFRDKFVRLNQDRWFVSDGWANGDYQACEWRADAVRVSAQDMRLTLSDRGGKVRPIGCPEIHTKQRLGYGLYEARMRSAAGSGLNTAFFTYIGPPNGVPEWDEIDFEFLGKDPHTVSVGYFTNGKGQPGKTVQLGFDASKEFHNYAIEWAPTKISWYVDGKVVFETPQGSKIPRNPGMLFFSLWSGAKEKDDWLGHFQYSSPVTADVQWTAYTPPDGSCQFPESLKCKMN